MSEKLKRENKSELSKSQKRKLKKLEVCASANVFQPRSDFDLCQLNFDAHVFLCAGGKGKGSSPIKKH